MTLKRTAVAAVAIVGVLAILVTGAAGAAGHKPKPGNKALHFTAVYSGFADYTSHRVFQCLDESEHSTGDWTVEYRFKVPRKGDADLIGADGNTFPNTTEAGYHVSGNGCGVTLSCTGDLETNPFPTEQLRPVLAGKPNSKGSAIDFTVDAPSDWRAKNVTGGDSCPKDETRAFFPAYQENQLPSMLQAEFKLPVGDLRDLRVEHKMLIPITSRSDQLPPTDCSRGGSTCTQKLEAWTGKVAIRREK